MNTPLSLPGRFVLAVAAATGALRNPARADLVAVVGETTGGPFLSRLRRRIRSTPEGREMLAERRPARFPEMDLRALRGMPKGTLGREYARFMDVRGFAPEERAAVRFVEDPEARWVLQRYRDVHDLWHVLTGMPTNVLGELGQKWFEWVQTGLPVAALSAVFGPLRLNTKQRRVLVRDLVPWALKSGSQSVDLLAIRYEDYLEENIDALRRKWSILMPDEFLKEPEVLFRRRSRKLQ